MKAKKRRRARDPYLGHIGKIHMRLGDIAHSINLAAIAHARLAEALERLTEERKAYDELVNANNRLRASDKEFSVQMREDFARGVERLAQASHALSNGQFSRDIVRDATEALNVLTLNSVDGKAP